MFFTLALPAEAEAHEKERIGLNHMAFGVRTLAELQAMGTQLDSAGVAHSGITVDQYGKKQFLWLDDPDGLRIEFYLRPA